MPDSFLFTPGLFDSTAIGTSFLPTATPPSPDAAITAGAGEDDDGAEEPGADKPADPRGTNFHLAADRALARGWLARARDNLAAAMDDVYMADVEPRLSRSRDSFDGPESQRRMVVEDQPKNPLASLAAGARNSDEAHNRSGTLGLLNQGGKLVLWPQLMLLEACNDAHPPDTGGRNSNASSSASW